MQLRPLVLALAVAGCTASADQVAPPQYSMYFPTGMVLSPDERYLFVLSADSDLRYSAGAVQTFDLDQVDAIADAWRDRKTIPTDCHALATRPTVLNCPTVRTDGTLMPVIVPGGSVQIGSFGVSVALQALERNGAPSSVVRLFATVRGDPSLTWMDFDESTGTMSCGSGTGFARCDQAHRLARIRNDETLPGLPLEPFGVTIDAPNHHVFVTHFTSGQVTLASAPSEVGSAPVLQDINSSLFAFNSSNGSLGAVGAAPRLPGDARGLVYITGRTEARVAIVHAVPGPPLADGTPTEQVVRTGSFFYDGLMNSGLFGDARSLAFSADGNRAYVVRRTPSELDVLDTSLDATGQPVNRSVAALELCAQPANLALADFGEGARVAVPCFANGQLWIFDPENLQLVAAEDSGRGPNGIAVSVSRQKIYVGNYAEDTLMVIDTTPGLPQQNRAQLQLGTERPVER